MQSRKGDPSIFISFDACFDCFHSLAALCLRFIYIKILESYDQLGLKPYPLHSQDEKTVVAYGDASIMGTMKAHTPIPVKVIFMFTHLLIFSLTYPRRKLFAQLQRRLAFLVIMNFELLSRKTKQ